MGAGTLALIAVAVANAAGAPALRIAARAIKPGELVVVTIDVPASTAAGEVRVRAFEHDFTPFEEGSGRLRVLIGIDLDTKAGRHLLTVDAAGQHIVRELVVLPKVFPTRRLTVDPDFVTPPASVAARIRNESMLLTRTWETPGPARLWTTPFVAPVPQPSNSAFGTRSIFNGVPRNAHGGADFLSPSGARVKAPSGGRVVIARDLYYSGNTVVIDHGLGLFSMLAHLSSIDVREGDVVTTGQNVGLVGATGRVTGPHLHWAVRVGSARIDPIAVLALLGSTGKTVGRRE